MTDETFGEVIYSYTRAQAIEDGVLVDVTETAKEAGIKYPTVVTEAVWRKCVEVPDGLEGEGQSEGGRLWDVLYMFAVAARKCSGSLFYYKIGVRNKPGKNELVELKAHCGPGDNMEPVITIMRIDED